MENLAHLLCVPLALSQKKSKMKDKVLSPQPMNAQAHYPHIPGQGKNHPEALQLRRSYLDTLVKGINLNYDSQGLHLEQIQNNIENFVGTTEIPLGLVGPLLFKNQDQSEWVHTALATAEGALVASMNRGAKALSESGGFRSHILHQKMLRTPMFTFQSMHEALAFDQWVKRHFEVIRGIAQEQSNHAELLEIKSVVVGKIVHLKFIYSTHDAAGQNMTTACTWQACLYIDKQFPEETGFEILNFVIDGNGASDKKVSFYSMQNGRGIHVIAEALITHEALSRTLRTTAEDMFRAFNHSMAISRFDGMIGYNINIANAIAGIFASTGQDLACIHESSIGILQLEPTDEGLYVSLSLPNLVVGTVGGGTHLPIASQTLELMSCKGPGSARRFAQLIAGFALSLELSTLAAIVSGQFVRAHQSLGRNKPKNWLLKADLNPDFFNNQFAFHHPVQSIEWLPNPFEDNGILTELSRKATKKLIGLFPADLHLESGKKLELILKSKALGSELNQGLHFMASNIDAKLADELQAHQAKLEYANSHLKELRVYQALQKAGLGIMPKFYGAVENEEQEIYLLALERLNPDQLQIFNAENHPEAWTLELQHQVIRSIHQVHKAFADKDLANLELQDAEDFMEARSLFQAFIDVNRKDYQHLNLDPYFQKMLGFLKEFEDGGTQGKGRKTLIHNDFNPRNIAIRNNDQACIYDWELAQQGLVQRDIFEFLAFSLEAGFKGNRLLVLLDWHYALAQEFNAKDYSRKDYLEDMALVAKSFLLQRVNFYLSGSTLVNYPFIERVFKSSFEMLAVVEREIRRLS